MEVDTVMFLRITITVLKLKWRVPLKKMANEITNPESVGLV